MALRAGDIVAGIALRVDSAAFDIEAFGRKPKIFVLTESRVHALKIRVL